MDLLVFWEWRNGRGQTRTWTVDCMGGREVGEGRVGVPVV